MKTYFKLLVVLLCALPLAWKFPYLLNGWRFSPLDRYDWLFFAAALLALALALPFVRRRAGSADWRGLLLMLPGAACIGAGVWLPMNSLVIIGGILLLGGSWWLCWGWALCFSLLPVAGLLLLGVTSSSFWLEEGIRELLGFMPLRAVALKGLAAAALLLWQTAICMFARIPNCWTATYGGGLAVLALLLAVSIVHVPLQGESLLLRIGDLKPGDYLGREQTLTDQESRFFAGNTARKFIYADARHSLMLLAVVLGDDIHRIHPAALCMQSGGWTIESSSQRLLKLPGLSGAVQRLKARYNGMNYLVYVWYADPAFSTGSFPLFRQRWSADGNWQTYQLFTPDDDDADQRLTDFIAAVLSTPIAAEKPH